MSKIIDNDGNVIFEFDIEVTEGLVDFISSLERMQQVYANAKFTLADEIKKELTDNLDDIMRGG